MAQKVLLAAAFLFLLFAVSAGAGGEDSEAEQERDILKASAEILREVERRRGLDFKTEVPRELKTRAAIGEKYRLSAAEDSREEWNNWEKALAALGLIDDDTNLKDLYVKMCSASVGGYYDWEAKKLVVLDPEGYPDDRLWFLLRMAMAHELTHALDDQHFTLHREELKGAEKGDEEMAWRCLIEGTATRVGWEFVYEESGRPLPATYWPGWLNKYLRGEGDARLKDIPLVLQIDLGIPYPAGAVFVDRAIKAGGWERVNELFRDPPQSSEQILHPEKALSDDPDYPVDIDFDGVLETLGDGWRAIELGVLGEIGAITLFKTHGFGIDFYKYAGGWDGDKYLVAEREEDGRLVVFMRWVWDTKEDAIEFAEGLGALFARKYTGEKLLVSKESAYRLWSTDCGYSLIKRDGRGVIVLDRAPAGIVEDEILHRALWNAPLSVDSRDKDVPENAAPVEYAPRTWEDWTLDRE